LLAAAGVAVLAWIVDRGAGPVLLLAGVGILGGVLYTAPPVNLAYRGWGEACIFLCFGILPVVGAYYVQAGRLDVRTIPASLPLACLITNIIWINQFPDHEADKRCGKLNLVVRLGLRRAVLVYDLLLAGALASILSLATNDSLGPRVYPGLLGLPLSVAASAILHRHYATPERLVPAQGLTILAHLATGLLLCLGMLVF